MEEILASIRRIISDEEDSGNESSDAPQASDLEDNPVEIEAAEDMGDASAMSQDDLDKLFDMDIDGGDTADITDNDDVDEMAAAMAEAESEAEDDDVLELTEELAIEEDDASIAEDLGEIGEMAGAIVDDDIAFVEQLAVASEPVVERAAEEQAAEENASSAPAVATKPVPDTDLPLVGEDSALTSEQTGAAVHAALDNLSDMFIGGNAQTVEDLVRNMLRPMLKAWLDQNLPVLVQEMVQKEIQRITRRR